MKSILQPKLETLIRREQIWENCVLEQNYWMIVIPYKEKLVAVISPRISKKCKNVLQDKNEILLDQQLVFA